MTDQDTLMKVLTDVNQLLGTAKNILEIPSADGLGPTYLLNTGQYALIATPPVSYTPMKVLSSIAGLRFTSYDEIVRYFQRIYKSEDRPSYIDNVIITNGYRFATLGSPGYMVSYRGTMCRFCRFCECYRRNVLEYSCKICSTVQEANPEIGHGFVCLKCVDHEYNNDGVIDCPNSSIMNSIADHSCTVKPIKNIHVTVKCDACQNQIMFGDRIYTSSKNDVDVCENCVGTPLGSSLIQKYCLTKTIYGRVSLCIDIGSVADWVPIYTDGEDNYVVLCLNDANNNKCVGITTVNPEGNLEFTIISDDDKQTDPKSLIVHRILNKIKRQLKKHNLRQIAHECYGGSLITHDYLSPMNANASPAVRYSSRKKVDLT